jgi:hypothetical protein
LAGATWGVRKGAAFTPACTENQVWWQKAHDATARMRSRGSK